MIYSRFSRHSVRSDLAFKKASLTSQEFENETNINTIVNKYLRTGYLPPEKAQQAFLDVSEVGDYREMLERINRAQNSFLELPSQLREQFRNNPAEFLAFADDPANADALVELGLATLIKEPDPQPDPQPDPDPKLEVTPKVE